MGSSLTATSSLPSLMACRHQAGHFGAGPLTGLSTRCRAARGTCKNRAQLLQPRCLAKQALHVLPQGKGVAVLQPQAFVQQTTERPRMKAAL